MKQDSDANKKLKMFSDDEYDQHFKLKKAGPERVLGRMHNTVKHAIIPFQVGGAMDIYYFSSALNGTAFVTMELIEPDGTGQVPSEIGTYELVAFTKYRISDQGKSEFDAIERCIGTIFTSIRRFSYQAKLNPFETCEIPKNRNHEIISVVLDKYEKPGTEFTIGKSKHGLLMCIEVFPTELMFARENGTPALLNLMKAKGNYPYSDLNREPVV